jgi:hypothetical protein
MRKSRDMLEVLDACTPGYRGYIWVMMRSSGVYFLVMTLFLKSSTIREIPCSGYLRGVHILMEGLNTRYDK